MAKHISQLCGERPAVCLPKGDGAIRDHLSTHECLTSLRNNPQQKQHGQLLAATPTRT